MHKLTQEEVEIIETLALLDSQAINIAFGISNTLGLGQLSSSITDYSNMLRKMHGDIVLSYSSEYRTYIIKLLEQIDDSYKASVISELINPKVKSMTGLEFIEIIEQARIKNIDGEKDAKSR